MLKVPCDKNLASQLSRPGLQSKMSSCVFNCLSPRCPHVVFQSQRFLSFGLTLPVRVDVMGKDGGIMGSVHTEGTWQGNEVPRP